MNKELEKSILDLLRTAKDNVNYSMDDLYNELIDLHADDNNIVCPFCKQDNFDLIGLKQHYEDGRCEVYRNTPRYDLSSLHDDIEEGLKENDEVKAEEIAALRRDGEI